MIPSRPYDNTWHTPRHRKTERLTVTALAIGGPLDRNTLVGQTHVPFHYRHFGSSHSYTLSRIQIGTECLYVAFHTSSLRPSRNVELESLFYEARERTGVTVLHVQRSRK